MKKIGLTQFDLDGPYKLDLDASLVILGPEETLRLLKLTRRSHFKSSVLHGLDFDDFLATAERKTALSFLKETQGRASSPEERRQQIIRAPDGQRSRPVTGGIDEDSPQFTRGGETASGQAAWAKIDAFRAVYILQPDTVTLPTIIPLVNPRREIEKTDAIYQAADGSKKQVHREYTLSPLGRRLSVFSVIN